MNNLLSTVLSMGPSPFVQGFNQSLPQQSALLNMAGRLRNVGKVWADRGGFGGTGTPGQGGSFGNQAPAMVTSPRIGSPVGPPSTATSNVLMQAYEPGFASQIAQQGAAGQQTQLYPILNMIKRFRQFGSPTAQVAGQRSGSLLQTALQQVQGAGGWDVGGQSGGSGSVPAGLGSTTAGGSSLYPTGGFGSREGTYGPLAGFIFRHTPQTVLMSEGPMYQAARDYYLGPERPSFAAVH